MNTIKPSEISEVLLSQLKGIDSELHYEEVGKVLQVSDGVVRIHGLLKAEAGELGLRVKETGLALPCGASTRWCSKSR